MKIIPPTPIAPSHFVSPSPAASLGPSCNLAALNSTETNCVTLSNKDGEASVMGRIPDSVSAILTEGFDKIDIKLSKLAAHVKLPFHQVVARYIRSHTHTHAPNNWNIYLKYFAKNTEQELARLPKNEEVVLSPLHDVRKRCYDLFKAEYKDTYPIILETWKDAHAMENMGGTVAQRRKLFDKTIKDLNHTVRCYLFTLWILLKNAF